MSEEEIKMNVDLKELHNLEEYIANLQKQAELGEHYKHLYSEVKKQKNDVVEYIKKNNLYHIEEHTITPQSTTSYIEVKRYIVSHKNVLLRMLGEIDVED